MEQMTSHSDIKVHIIFTLMISNRRIKKLWITILLNWLNGRRNPITYDVNYKFMINECPFLRAGSVIETENGLKWFIMARSQGSLICDSIDDLTMDQIHIMDRYTGSAVLISDIQKDEL